MKDWKLIKRSIKGKEETVTRSLRLPKALDEYCNLQDNASDFIRELIKVHMRVRGIDPHKELTKDEEELQGTINEFYRSVKKTWSRKDIETGITYPSPETITDAQLDEIFDFVARQYEEFDLVDQCRKDKQLARTVYARVRDNQLAYVQRDRERNEREKERERRIAEEWAEIKRKKEEENEEENEKCNT